jgi:hypothetical protein
MVASKLGLSFVFIAGNETLTSKGAEVLAPVMGSAMAEASSNVAEKSMVMA